MELTKQLLNSAAYVENDNQTLESLILEEAGNIFQGTGAPWKRLKEFRAGPVFISMNKCKKFYMQRKGSKTMKRQLMKRGMMGIYAAICAGDAFGYRLCRYRDKCKNGNRKNWKRQRDRKVIL